MTPEANTSSGGVGREHRPAAQLMADAELARRRADAFERDVVAVTARMVFGRGKTRFVTADDEYGRKVLLEAHRRLDVMIGRRR
jgi:hypothetical protein